MPKKIDFFNKDNKNGTINTKNRTSDMGKNTKQIFGSKTSKPKMKDQDIADRPAPKRRGRRPKKILENITTNSDNLSDDGTQQKNNSAVILRLNIDPSKLKNIKKPQPIKKIKPQQPHKKIAYMDDDELSDGMFKNDIPGDDTCHKCAKNEKIVSVLKSKLERYEKKEQFDKSNKIYSNKLNFISHSSGKKLTIKKTNIKCWWDCHTFTTLPCFLPELFHNNIYHVTGCFCSFNCALAYNLYYLKDSKIYQRKSLIYKLYREMYGSSLEDDDIEIKEAPPKEILEDFGGDMSIDVFRRSLIMVKKEFIVFFPPIRPINITIEERNIENDDNNDKEYVLKRSKPLAKKRSVISSMKNHADNKNSDD